jgi:acetyltransferase
VRFDERDEFLDHELETKDGTRVLIRPARPTDREAVEKMFRSCSGETLYTRFLSPGLGVPLRYLDRLIAHHPPAATALVAETVEGAPRIVALLNLIETEPGEAGEIAIMVVDDFQNRGLGSGLSGCLVELAQRWRLKRFIADVDAGNRRVFHLIKRSGLPSAVSIDQGIAHVELDAESAD